MTPVSSAQPTKLGDIEGSALDRFRQGDEAKKLTDWVRSEFTKSKEARTRKQLQWYINMAMFYGQQWVELTRKAMPNGYSDRLFVPKKPYYQQRKTINRVRSFVRQETSKFLSTTPSAVAVPATAEDQDIRSAYAAEQAWESISSTGKIRSSFTKAIWWMTITGNGFVKEWWDQQSIDKASGQPGVIKFGSVSPFHLFVPDLREQEIEDQPYIINAYVKPINWVRHYFGDLPGLVPSTIAANSLLDDAYLNLSTANNTNLDSVVLYEAWVKPGATPLLPEGGLIVCADGCLISVVKDGFPYEHGQYPYTKFEHISTATFYADSPLVDINELQKEFNELRTDISLAGKRMGRPQLVSQKGAIVSGKMTNEPGLLIEYRPGFQPPQPIPLSPLPQYYVDQQDRVLQDIDDLTGQHEVSRGQAPAGVTAGTAISYLQEKDDQYLTPQYQGIEDGFEKLATQGISLFIQYVDLPRKIKTIGADGTFDTVLLSGADISAGTDIRIEPGSAIGQSQAGKRAQVMDMFSVGMIDQPQALKLLEMGGAQKVLDTLNAAEKKAQRENTKMKLLTPEMLAQADEQFVQQVMPQFMQQAGIDPENMDPALMQQMPQIEQQIIDERPPIVLVDDFDIHPVHIDNHNKFRMSQEYEALTDELKAEFDKHVKMHERMYNEQQMQQQLKVLSSPGGPMGPAGPGGTPDAGGPADAGPMGPGATMSGNGAVPDAAAQLGGLGQ